MSKDFKTNIINDVQKESTPEEILGIANSATSLITEAQKSKNNKDKHMHLVIPQALHQELKTIAQEQGLSANKYITLAIQYMNNSVRKEQSL